MFQREIILLLWVKKIQITQVKKNVDLNTIGIKSNNVDLTSHKKTNKPTKSTTT